MSYSRKKPKLTADYGFDLAVMTGVVTVRFGDSVVTRLRAVRRPARNDPAHLISMLDREIEERQIIEETVTPVLARLFALVADPSMVVD